METFGEIGTVCGGKNRQNWCQFLKLGTKWHQIEMPGLGKLWALIGWMADIRELSEDW